MPACSTAGLHGTWAVSDARVLPAPSGWNPVRTPTTPQYDTWVVHTSVSEAARSTIPHAATPAPDWIRASPSRKRKILRSAAWTRPRRESSGRIGTQPRPREKVRSKIVASVEKLPGSPSPPQCHSPFVSAFQCASTRRCPSSSIASMRAPGRIAIGSPECHHEPDAGEWPGGSWWVRVASRSEATSKHRT